MSTWKILGIKRTDDIAEIRRAYARKLKATDVDANPAAFIALREAFERALGDAQSRRHRQEAAVHDDETPPDPPIEASPAADLPPASEPEAPAAEDPNVRFIALNGLLFPGDGAPPPDPEKLAGAVRAILDHPDMDHVDRSANVEFWLAEALYDAIPRGDPVIPMAIDHFHWDRKAGDWDQHWLLEELVKRRDALTLVDQLANERHSLNWAWRDLTSDSPTLGLERVGRGGDIASLLHKIRSEAPAAEAYLNPDRVALWEERQNSSSIDTGVRWVWIAVVVLVALARLVSVTSAPTQPSPPAARGNLTDPGVDLTPALDRLSNGRLDLADLQTSNPRLHSLLVDAWFDARGRGDSSLNVDVEAASVLDNFYSDAIRAAPPSIQSDYWRLKIDEAAWLRERGAPTCPVVQDLAYGTRYHFPLEIQDRFLALRVSVWRSVSDAPPPRRPSIMIPSAIATAAASRAHLDVAAFREAVRGNAAGENVCAARIALAETALARPSVESVPLIGDLTSLE